MIEFLTNDGQVIDVIASRDGELVSGPKLRDVARSWLRQGKSPSSFENEYASWTNGYAQSRRVPDDAARLSELRAVNVPALVAAGGFEEAQHPRDTKGKFAKKPGGGAGKKLKITHMLVHKSHGQPGDILTENGAGDKRVRWDGKQYELQQKNDKDQWITQKTAIKSKAYVAINDFDSDWREPGNAGEGSAKTKVSVPTQPQVKPTVAPTSHTPSSQPNAPKVAPSVTSVKSPSPGNPKSTASYTKITGQKGSQLGGTFQAPNGEKFYVKVSKSEDHARNEVLANSLYRALGVNTPTTELVTIDGQHFPGKEGKLGTQSRILNGTHNLPQMLKDPAYKKELYENFAVDAWLANWDVIGLGFDNIITTFDGKPARLDQGGTLLYRAQGAPKGDAFGDKVTEIDTLRNPSKNSASALAFKDITDDDIRKGVAKIEKLKPDDIDELVHKAGFTGKKADLLSSKLQARRADLISRYGSHVPEVAQPNAPAPSTLPTATNALGGTVKTYTALQKAKVQSIFDKHGVKWFNKTNAIYDAAHEVSTTHPDLTMADALDIMDQSLKKKTGNPFRTKVEKWLKTNQGKQHALAKGSSAALGGTAPKVSPTVSDITPNPNVATPKPAVEFGTPLPRQLTSDHADRLQERMNAAYPPPWNMSQVAALKRYTGDGYSSINDCLRGLAPCTSATNNTITQLRNAMKPSTDNIVVYRKTNPKAFGLKYSNEPGNSGYPDLNEQLSALVGKTFEDKGVSSTSITDGTWHGLVHMEIEVPKGAKIAWVKRISKHPHENEIVLMPGTRFEVLSVTPAPSFPGGQHQLLKLRVIVDEG